MRKLLTCLLAAALVTGCATQKAPTYYIHTKFGAPEAARMLQPGVNAINGNAFMRQRGGGVVTCAGADVYLIPGTGYATERLGIIYGTNLERGVSRAPREPIWSPDPPAYKAYTRQTVCDAQGNFVFDHVADGTFYVVTSVAWQVGTRLEGANLMHRVTVKNGDSPRVVLSS